MIDLPRPRVSFPIPDSKSLQVRLKRSGLLFQVDETLLQLVKLQREKGCYSWQLSKPMNNV